ncbi:MAG TPA: PEP-CTERM sorting domain-containing protein [Isosphaeraceae bacterium]|jgi:hypothetical protein
MKRHHGRTCRCLALVGLLALGASSARAAFLTGAVVYSTDAAGAASSGEYWNTTGGDNRYNLYVAIGPGDPILNPGDGASTSLNFPLPVGTYTYDIYGEGSTKIDHYGLALFFNGNNSAPAIAAFTATNTASATAVTTADGSVGLDSSSASSPGTLTFVDTTTTVTLTNFSWNAPTTGGLDRVSGYGSTPSGSPDFLGSFTLTVTPNLGTPATAPEPASLALLGVGLAGVFGIARRRKARISA